MLLKIRLKLQISVMWNLNSDIRFYQIMMYHQNFQHIMISLKKYVMMVLKKDMEKIQPKKFWKEQNMKLELSKKWAMWIIS